MQEIKSRKRIIGFSGVCVQSKRTKYETIYFPTREEFFSSMATQNFALPAPIMEYIFKNIESPELYQKLIKCAKIIFIKNPRLILDNVLIDNENGWKARCDLKRPSHFDKETDISKVESKIWMANRLEICGIHPGPDIATKVIPRFDFYNVRYLRLGSVEISMEELKFLSRGVKNVKIDFSKVYFKTGGYRAPLEAIMGHFRGAERYSMFFNLGGQKGLVQNYKKFVEICSSIKEVQFSRMPRNFKSWKFFNNLSVTQSRSLIKICGYSQCSTVVDHIKNRKKFSFVPPVISYMGGRGYEELENIQAEVAAKLL